MTTYKNLSNEALISFLINPRFLTTLDVRMAIKAELMQRGVTEISVPLDFSSAGYNDKKIAEIFETLQQKP